jgi:hypothetical protein
MFARLRALFRHRPVRPAAGYRPALERLEDRTVPATTTFGSTMTSFGTPNAIFGSGFGSTAAGFGLGNPGFGVGGAPTTTFGTLALGLGVPGFGTTTVTGVGLGLGSSGFGAGVAGFGVGPLGLGTTASLGLGSTAFGITPVNFGLTGTGFGLATPATAFLNPATDLTAFGLGLGIPSFTNSNNVLGLTSPTFTAFGTADFGLNTPGIDLSTFALGLGNPALNVTQNSFGINGNILAAGLGFTGGTSIDASLLATAAQITQQAIALDQQAQQQAFNAALQTLGGQLLPGDSNVLAGMLPILQQLGVTLPALNSLSTQAITLLNSNPTANQFAAASINQHIEDIQLLQAEVTAGSNANAVNFSVGALPTLSSNLLLALQFQQSQQNQTH